MSVRTYNPSVRVGNWNEDIQLEEDSLKDFLDKREKGELLIQKNGNLAGVALQKKQLSISQDGYVHYGHMVMLCCKGAADRTKYFTGVDPRDDCSLALNLTDPMQLTQDKFADICGVSGCVSMEPVLRNVFCVKSIEGCNDGDVLRYGQPFYLSTLPEAGNLLLHSDQLTFMKCTKKSRHQLVSLVSEASFLTQWMILHKDPRLRMEFEGAPVPANEPVIVTHCKTNQNLSVEEAFRVRTPLGREYEISSHTSLNSHKAEEDFNIWTITMGVPGDSMMTSLSQNTNQSAMSSEFKSQSIPLSSATTPSTANQNTAEQPTTTEN
ncbi:cilia- and flagella-associated protein 161 isoform X1 [Patella vulgata]|uniref:cilia- and flagella-associated protein 161 isoform X1 n=1 Tax=Patella vulgata TaxID=6465 RepID=UPI00217F857C|nr:cilia- and flagella-associated protein 161 isoform X1 [Patella vulgata]